MAFNNFDAEMSRFENEISNVNTAPRMPMMPPVPPPPGMFPPIIPGLPIPPPPPPPPGVMAQLMNNTAPSPAPTRLPPRPAFVPHQLRHRVPQQSIPFSSSSIRSTPMASSIPQRAPSPPPPQLQSQSSTSSQPQSTLSAQPLLYKNQATNEKTNQSSETSIGPPQRPIQPPVVEPKPSTSKIDKPSTSKPEPNPHPVSKAYAAMAQPMETNDYDNDNNSASKKKSKAKPSKKARHVRMAGGSTWEDETLADWDPDDFRLFCGDLGNEVNDDVLTRAFNKYPSFTKAKVVRDKRTGKTRGYGFVSFKDSQDYIRAMREMNGKYVGNRPIKLRKSTWKDRNIDVVRKKIKDKVRLGLR